MSSDIHVKQHSLHHCFDKSSCCLKLFGSSQTCVSKRRGSAFKLKCIVIPLILYLTGEKQGIEEAVCIALKLSPPIPTNRQSLLPLLHLKIDR